MKLQNLSNTGHLGLIVGTLLVQMLLSLGVNESQAQPRPTVYNHQTIWTKTEATQIFPNRIGVGMDYIHRFIDEMQSGDVFDRTHRISVRSWVHYQFGKRCKKTRGFHSAP